MGDQKPTAPYQALGNHLKQRREKLQESLHEVCGAVEIEIEALNAIEAGTARPSEDILLLLISHFDIKDDEATKLWDLAEYDRNDLIIDQPDGTIVVPTNTRIDYTDMVHVVVNNFGVVMNFMQGGGFNNQPVPIARVGMSREHAKSVLELLKKTLEQSEQKNLPAPRNENKDNKKSDN